MHDRPNARISLLLALALVGSFLTTARAPASAAPSATGGALQAAFHAAAVEFKVPESVLLAVSYNVSRWEGHDGAPSTTGGYGVMHLTDVADAPAENAKGDEGPARALTGGPAFHTLTRAAGLLHESPSQLKTDPAQNIRGGAALLAQYARDTTGAVPGNVADWYGAVAAYSGSSQAAVALGFADDVYATLNSGAARVLPGGETVQLVAAPVAPNKATARALPLRNADRRGVDCPQGLACEYIPAAYQQNSPDPSDYGNYDLANRPADGLDVRYIVMHDTETTFADAVAIFQNPLSYVSAHYVVRSADGFVAEMVRPQNVAWQAGNWYINSHSIGIEQEGFAIEGATWYTEQLYHASARLVRYLADRYGIPLDRVHILGHDNVPGPTASYQPGMHWDPGPYWDWAHFMAVVGAPITPSGRPGASGVVTINPNWATNQPPLLDCEHGGAAMPPQPASFVYLHTAPSASSPYITDPGAPGSAPLCANQWGDKAATGEQFVLADRQGDWDAIWFAGQEAWFYNPHHQNTVPGAGLIVTPKAGRPSIPVYGRAYPEAAAYPPGITPQAIVPMQYTLSAGQRYVARDLVRGSYYYSPIYTPDLSDQVVVNGQIRYYEIFLDHRIAYVLASDVDVTPAP
jgi:N-acetyl-anhydromuramyl-L-alanine amidase AmpD